MTTRAYEVNIQAGIYTGAYPSRREFFKTCIAACTPHPLSEDPHRTVPETKNQDQNQNQNSN